MKVLLIAAVFAGAVLTNVAGADPLICNEPWYTPQPHPPHPMPCHTRTQAGRAQGHPRDSHGPTRVPGANPAPPSDTDFGCGFYAVSDPSSDAPDDTMTGEIEGGAILQNGRLTCTIQINGWYHAAADSAGAWATGTNGTTTLEPTLVSYLAPEDSQAYLCTQFNDGTTTYYWDDTTNTWTTNNAASCGAATTFSAGPASDLVSEVLEPVGELAAGLARDLGDPLACPVLSGLAGSYGATTINAQGDVFYLGEPFWDCPPYDLS